MPNATVTSLRSTTCTVACQDDIVSCRLLPNRVICPLGKTLRDLSGHLLLEYIHRRTGTYCLEQNDATNTLGAHRSCALQGAYNVASHHPFGCEQQFDNMPPLAAGAASTIRLELVLLVHCSTRSSPSSENEVCFFCHCCHDTFSVVIADNCNRERD